MCVNNLRQYEKSVLLELLDLTNRMNNLHSNMGGRDARPERVALLKCMRIIQKEIDREHGREDQEQR